MPFKKSKPESLLTIFYKNPELGKVKQRLAAAIGEAKAYSIHLLLCEHTIGIRKSFPFRRRFITQTLLIETTIGRTTNFKNIHKPDLILERKWQMPFGWVSTMDIVRFVSLAQIVSTSPQALSMRPSEGFLHTMW
jgi:hypothetical protein